MCSQLSCHAIAVVTPVSLPSSLVRVVQSVLPAKGVAALVIWIVWTSYKVARLCGIRSSDGAYEKYPYKYGYFECSEVRCDVVEVTGFEPAASTSRT